MFAEPALPPVAVRLAKSGAPPGNMRIDQRGCVIHPRPPLRVGLKGVRKPFRKSASRFPLTGTSTVRTKASYFARARALHDPDLPCRDASRRAASIARSRELQHARLPDACWTQSRARRKFRCAKRRWPADRRPLAEPGRSSRSGQCRMAAPTLRSNTSIEVSTVVVSRNTRGVSSTAARSLRLRRRQWPSSAAPSM